MDYLGVDVVLDAQRGPVILEVNVRPGLAVQLANRMGLRASLETEVT
jgi:D-alanine-D-alanine ligase-like ATP-grasp enzyme